MVVHRRHHCCCPNRYRHSEGECPSHEECWQCPRLSCPTLKDLHLRAGGFCLGFRYTWRNSVLLVPPSQHPYGWPLLEIDIVMSSSLFMLITYYSVMTDTNEHD